MGSHALYFSTLLAQSSTHLLFFPRREGMAEPQVRIKLSLPFILLWMCSANVGNLKHKIDYL